MNGIERCEFCLKRYLQISDEKVPDINKKSPVESKDKNEKTKTVLKRILNRLKRILSINRLV